MMTGPSRNRRRRGRRGQRPRQDEPRQEEQASPEAPSQNLGSRETAEHADARQDRGARQAQNDQQSQGERQGGGPRKRSRGKRRPNRRPVIAAMPTEVLKERVRDIRPSGSIAIRNLDDVTTPDGMRFGCPMLTRTRLGMPFAQGQRVPRCSMGWGLHNEEEASFCMRTPDLRDCWQEHPEREAALRANEEENAAD